MKFNFFKTKLPGRVLKAIAPDAEFTSKTKGRFLAVYDARHSRTYRTKAVSFALRVLAFIFVVIGLTAGASVYADTQNVSADNPLYPLKRLSESVRLALAPPEKRPELQATFAVRRATEISDLQKRAPSSTLIAGLTRDLEDDVSSSLSATEANNIDRDRLASLCQKISASAELSLPVLEKEESSSEAALAERLNDRCGSSIGIASTSTVATSTVPVDAFKRIGSGRHQEGGTAGAAIKIGTTTFSTSVPDPLRLGRLWRWGVSSTFTDGVKNASDTGATSSGQKTSVPPPSGIPEASPSSLTDPSPLPTPSSPSSVGTGISL